MRDVMAGYVNRGDVAGLVTLLARRGEVHVDAIGMKEKGGSEPIRRDTIFRITSMTKPITAVATMILVEQCKLRLDDPVDRLLPELANRRVLKRPDGPLNDTEPAYRPISVRDLLTFRMGLGIDMALADSCPFKKAVSELDIVGFGPPKQAATHTPDEWIRRLATLPLMHQPGQKWLYNTGSCVLGVLIARVSGQPLETFFRQHIFEPLGMRDTAFSVPPEKLDRLAASYWPNSRTGELELHDGVANSHWQSPPAFPDASGGLVSTIEDYFAFGQMMLKKGKLGGERILSRTSVEAMTTDQLTAEQKAVSGFFPGYFDTLGWGFGVSMVSKRDGVSAVPGRYGWDGGSGTSWWSDPSEDLVGILMTQRAAFPQFSGVWLDFWTSVYQAIDD
jgi:CubicO group peptidase (beta-lactamase class C family)